MYSWYQNLPDLHRILIRYVIINFETIISFLFQRIIIFNTYYFIYYFQHLNSELAAIILKRLKRVFWHQKQIWAHECEANYVFNDDLREAFIVDPSKINNSGFRQYFRNVLNEFRQKIVYRIYRDKVSEVVGSNCNCSYLNKICNRQRVLKWMSFYLIIIMLWYGYYAKNIQFYLNLCIPI